MPNHKLLNNILKLTGTIYCSSANISGNEPVKNTKGAIKIFGNKKDLFYVEGKELGGMPSTIIDFDNKAVIRQGSIKANTIIKML
jgi:L-threonylcarbamoyladenylate synthase